jgi:hypothetical protein
MRYDITPTERLGPGSPLSDTGFLNDMPRMLVQIKRPAEEVKDLLIAMKLIAEYLDGIKDRKALLEARTHINY